MTDLERKNKELDEKIESYKRCGCSHCADFLRTIAFMQVELRATEGRVRREYVKLLNAVDASNLHKITCDDVDGVNWFDARDACLAKGRD